MITNFPFLLSGLAATKFLQAIKYGFVGSFLAGLIVAFAHTSLVPNNFPGIQLPKLVVYPEPLKKNSRYTRILKRFWCH